jgi:hypothetical protein
MEVFKMELYLVKSSSQDEWGSEYWENLQIFNNLAAARNFAAKVKRLIRSDKATNTDDVAIENFTLKSDSEIV